VPDDHHFRKFNREATVESIQAGLERAEHKRKITKRFSEMIYAKVVPFLATHVAILSPLYAERIGTNLTQQKIWVSDFAIWFNRNILIVLFWVFTLSLLYVLSMTHVLKATTSQGGLDEVRFAPVFPYWLTPAVAFLLVAALILRRSPFFSVFFVPSFPPITPPPPCQP